MSDGIDGLWEEVIALRNDLEALRRESEEAVANYNGLLDAQMVEIKLRQEAQAKLQRAREALREAVNHLEWCGYGDAWERECAESEKLPERLRKALADLDEGGDDGHQDVAHDRVWIKGISVFSSTNGEWVEKRLPSTRLSDPESVAGGR